MQSAEREQPPARVFASRHGNVYMLEIAQLLVDGFADMGVTAELHLDGLPRSNTDIVVAPHEFYGLLEGVDEPAKVASARCSVALTTEQPNTKWFEEGFRYARFAPLILDLNRSSVDEFRRRGVRAEHLPVGFHPSWAAPSLGMDERDIDILFMGSVTDRRSRILAQLSDVLSGLRCRILLFDAAAPVNQGEAGFLHGRAKFELIARSKIMLNIHRSDLRYFEWPRLVQGMMNGAVVMTEPCDDHDPFVDGKHLVVMDADQMSSAAVDLLQDPARLESLSQAALQTLQVDLAWTDTLRSVWALVCGLETAQPHEPIERPRWDWSAIKEAGQRRLPSPLRRLASACFRFGWKLRRGGSRLIGLARWGRRAWSREGSNKALLLLPSPVRRVVKDHRLESIQARRTLEARLAQERGDALGYSVERSESVMRMTPIASVVIPLYNYAEHVEECLQSVAASTISDRLEIVVVDDNSRDHSPDVVRRFMDRHPEIATTLVKHWANQGLPNTRNRGFELSRAEAVFPLDADNTVLPRCLERLTEALNEDAGAAMAFPIIATFGDRQTLLSQFPWDVARLRKGNYIDAMALVRKSAWEEVGGYPTDLALYGWEDYSFWLSFAAHGLRGVLVPEILARYRYHAGSMINLTNIELERVMIELRRRYEVVFEG